MQTLLIVLSLFGAGLIFLCTSPTGSNITIDSTHYIAGAISLLAGKGYSTWYGSPQVMFPPLYSLILLAYSFAGIEIWQWARFINIIAFGLIIFISGRLFLNHIKSRLLAAVAIVAVTLSEPLMGVSIQILTEPVFTVFTLLSAIYLWRYLNGLRLTQLLLFSSITAILCLLKYQGISVIMIGFGLIALYMSEAPLRLRLGHLLVFCSISVTPVALWFLRNYAVASIATGVRIRISSTTVIPYFSLILDVLSRWIMPSKIPFFVRSSCTISAISLLTLVIVLSHRKRSYEHRGPSIQWVAGIFIISFILPILLFLPIRIEQYDEYYRIMSPIYPFLVLIVFSGLDDLSNLLRNLLKRGWLRHIIVAALCAMGMLYPSTHVIKIFLFNYRNLVEEGAYKIRWIESPIINWLNTNRPEGKIYSNLPFFIYFYTGTTACTSPAKSRYLWPLKECSLPKGTYYSECCLPINGKCYFIWWNHASYRLIYDPKELSALFEVKEIAVFPEGTIYLLKEFPTTELSYPSRS